MRGLAWCLTGLVSVAACKSDKAAEKKPAPEPPPAAAPAPPAPADATPVAVKPPEGALVGKPMEPQRMKAQLCDDREGCNIVAVEGVVPAPPFDELAYVTWLGYYQGEARALAVRLGERWYNVELYDNMDTGRGESSYSVQSLTVHTYGSGAVIAIIIDGSSDHWNHDDESTVTVSTKLLACGVGASGAPTCVSLTTAKSVEAPDKSDNYDHAISFTIEEGFVDLKPVKGKDPTREPGRRPLFFP